MPVVSLPAQQTHNIINPSFDLLVKTQFLLTSATALAGPIALLVLFVVFGKKYKTSTRPDLVEVRLVTTTGKRSSLPEQSGELNSERAIMSVSRESEFPPFEAHKTFEGGSLFGGRDLSQSSGSREKRKENLQAPTDGTDELRNTQTRSSPPLSLTPPVLPTTFFSLQDRRLSVAASSHGDFDPTLNHGVNLDTSSSEPSTTILSNVKASSPMPLPKPYTKIFPSDPLQSSSSTDAEMEDTSSTFAPSSFPSSSPILPLAPHAALESRHLGVGGEIVSVIDDSGADWKRHTRVYGGGVCLACMASGGNHGGFYGENVPLDQRRY
ncbi:hypothetical protein NUW58_g3830 [Xylaria curta]|uniref:Uncharacterized protein n=1 Tax=Xylaria curta TaxID=42375 RepID=A0ACC1PC70_9PEZI|nr:hypothetical protein NUW58_g3830 [Xylaria curta]